MSISLTPVQQALAERLCERGLYATVDEAVDAAFSLLMDEAEQRFELKHSIDAALAEDIWFSDEDLDRDLKEAADRLRAGGIAP